MDLEQQFTNSLLALQPRGPLWENKPGSIAERDAQILGTAIAKVYTKAESLMDEADRRTTRDYLEEWENQYGLAHTGSYEDRIAALNAFTGGGRQDISFYQSLCELNGITAQIAEHTPFMVGLSPCGGEDELGEPDIVYYWDIIVLAGSNDNLANLQRVIGTINQSHVILTYYDKRI